MTNLNITGTPRSKNFEGVQTTYNNVGTGKVVVSSAGTPVQFLSSNQESKRIDVQAYFNNANAVTVGASNVAGSQTVGTGQGVTLQPGTTYTFFITNVALMWVDSVANGDGVQFNFFF